MSIVDRLIAEGRITPATGDHRTTPPPPKIPGRPLSEILQEMRDEDDLMTPSPTLDASALVKLVVEEAESRRSNRWYVESSAW